MPSFDVVSKVDNQEVVNAIDQVQRELANRYDFKGAKASVELKENLIIVLADDQMKLKAMQDMIRQRLAKRGVSLLSVVFEDPTPAGGDMSRQEVKVKEGLSSDELKRLNKVIKESKLKVQSQIQGDQLRITGKKKDDLQGVIAHLRSTIQDLDLQFINFRD